MAVCSSCGSEGTRIRSRWSEDGTRLPDECPQCEPGSFEKFTVPSDKKIWMGYEANPNQYEKRYDSEGVYYVRKSEYRAEQEQRLMQSSEEERERQRSAEEHKRATRRTEPMTESEMLTALAKARMIAAALQQGTDIIH